MSEYHEAEARADDRDSAKTCLGCALSIVLALSLWTLSIVAVVLLVRLVA